MKADSNLVAHAWSMTFHVLRRGMNLCLGLGRTVILKLCSVRHASPGITFIFLRLLHRRLQNLGVVLTQFVNDQVAVTFHEHCVTNDQVMGKQTPGICRPPCNDSCGHSRHGVLQARLYWTLYFPNPSLHHVAWDNTWWLHKLFCGKPPCSLPHD